MDLVDVIESKRFLGGEFLLWLWYEGDRTGGAFDLGEAGEIIVAFDDQLVLEAYLAEAEQSRLTGGAPTDSAEARSALRSGKRVSKAKLRLTQGDREFVVTVTAGTFDLASVKLPSVLKMPEERLLERLSLLDDLADLWTRLYRQFLMRRLTDGWPEIREDMVRWSLAPPAEA